MPSRSNQYDEIKRSVRQLKKLETRIRFEGMDISRRPPSADLVWAAFFDLHEVATGKAKYSIYALAAMSKDEYRSAIDEFFFHVYYRFYKENGIEDMNIYDPGILSQLGLPIDADNAAIKKKFHELAMKYHPDTGGDAARFIELMKEYRKLIGKGK